jgi:hypothetical protein
MVQRHLVSQFFPNIELLCLGQPIQRHFFHADDRVVFLNETTETDTTRRCLLHK